MGARVAPNGIFIITKNVEESSRKILSFEIFFVGSIEREIHEFLRKGGGPSGGEGLEKMAPKLILFQIHSRFRISHQIAFNIPCEQKHFFAEIRLY